jgi:hypothetical protein
MEQVVQGDGRKTWKDTNPRRGASCCHNCPTQDNYKTRPVLPTPFIFGGFFGRYIYIYIEEKLYNALCEFELILEVCSSIICKAATKETKVQKLGT